MQSLRDLLSQVRADSPIIFDVVRHGATVMNGIPGVSVDYERGCSNVPLTEEGRQEALSAGLKLKGRGIRVIRSSNLNRAQETAEIIGEVLNVKPQFDARLQPWKVGGLTGRDMREVLPVLGNYARNRPDTPIEGGGESFNEFHLRAFDGIASAVNSNPGKVLIVSHTRVQCLLTAWKAEGYPIEHTIDIDTFLEPGRPPGNIMEFRIHKQVLNGCLDERLTHVEADYQAGHGKEICKTCRFSDHQSPPHCVWVKNIEKRGYCRLWKPSES